MFLHFIKEKADAQIDQSINGIQSNNINDSKIVEKKDKTNSKKVMKFLIIFRKKIEFHLFSNFVKIQTRI